MSYAQQADIENTFGTSNVAAWTLYETGTPTASADATRIAAALDYADSEINAFFTTGPYVVPLVCNLTQSTVTYWAAVIAGIWLYGSRSTTIDIDHADQRFRAFKTAVYSDMQLYKSGVKRLDAPVRYPHATAPVPCA